jgi:hypothetical protein
MLNCIEIYSVEVLLKRSENLISLLSRFLHERQMRNKNSSAMFFFDIDGNVTE